MRVRIKVRQAKIFINYFRTAIENICAIIDAKIKTKQGLLQFCANSEKISAYVRSSIFFGPGTLGRPIEHTVVLSLG